MEETKIIFEAVLITRTGPDDFNSSSKLANSQNKVLASYYTSLTL